MAIRYEVNYDKQEITAFIDDCKYDGVNKIRKMLRQNNDMISIPENFDMIAKWNKYLMNDTYSGTVDLHGNDKFDEENGKYFAKEKVIENYKRALNKRIFNFNEEVLYKTSSYFDDYSTDHWIYFL